MASGPQTSKRIFLVDAPRTYSQVFNKLFLAHPDLGHIFHPMICAMYGRERVGLNLKHCEAAEEAGKALSLKTGMTESLEEAAKRMEKYILQIEEQVRLFNRFRLT